MRLYLPRIHLLILIANILLLPGIILSEFRGNTEYVDSYIDSNNLIHPNLFENIEDNNVMNEDVIPTRQDGQHNEGPQHTTTHLVGYGKYWNNHHESDHQHPLLQQQHQQQHQQEDQIASRNLLRKLTENLIKQSLMRQHSAVSPSSSSPMSSSSSPFLYPSSRSVFYRAYRLKRDDLGWKRSIPYGVK
uniref:Uncharacterized protein n=1 Tax=Trichobilharzia regenti TaxID=157069 RepID=A0AA85K9C4_TRIRE|nr:unnamed protein product [Trichobilharzia regenti]